jgi:hypothetical protein
MIDKSSTSARIPIVGSSPTLSINLFYEPIDLVVLARIRQDSSVVLSRAKNVRVVISQDPTHTSEGVLAKLAGHLMLPQLPQGGGKDKG